MTAIKIKSTLLILLVFVVATSFAQVGIGIASPDNSAMLDVSSTTKGFLPPRMDATARGLITTPASGLLIYNTSTNQLNYYNGSAWQIVDTSTGFVNLTTAQTIAGNKTFTGMLTPMGRLMLPMGELNYFNYSGYSNTISGTSTGASGTDNMSKINPPSGVNFVNDMFGTGTNTRLTYTGTTTRLFHIALSFSFSPGSNGDLYIFGVGKNGTVQNSSKIVLKAGNASDNQSSAMHVMLQLATNDYIEFYVGKIGGTGSINIKSFNFFAMGM